MEGVGVNERRLIAHNGDMAFPEQQIAALQGGNIGPVRNRRPDGLLLHKGGKSYLKLPLQEHDVTQISPTRDTRLRWMQSVIGCTHYVAGASEIKYLNMADAPGVQFIARDEISESDRAYIPQL